MAERFHDKVVVVAGGTGALGRAVSLAFLAEGARVVVTYRQAKELEALRTSAGERASALTGQVVDVTDTAATERFAGKIVAEQRRIDVVVNAVGGYAGGTALWETAPEVFERMLSLNLRAGFALAWATVPAMLRQRSGAVVNVASKAAFDHGAGAAAYAASKAAAVAMIHSLAADVKGRGVRVNSVVPSIFDTEENRKAMPGADFSRWPKPEEIAEVVLFLCSDEARLIHGASVPVYGET